MSVNRLAELVKKKGGNASDMLSKQLTDTQKAKQKDVDDQVQQYDQIGAWIEKIKEKTEEIVKIKNKDQKEASPAKRTANAAAIDAAVQECMSLANNIKTQLNSLKEENKKFMEDPKNNAQDSTRGQVRLNLHNTNLKRFMSTMNAFNAARQEYKKQSEERQVRQMVNVGLDEDKAKDLIESGGDYQDVIAKALASDALVDQINDLRDRSAEIMKLERSVEEVFRMFQDLATLVDLQGETLNVIEERISKSKDYVEKGEKEIVEAMEYQDSNRKCLCWMLLIGSVVLLAVVLPLTL